VPDACNLHGCELHESIAKRWRSELERTSGSAERSRLSITCAYELRVRGTGDSNVPLDRMREMLFPEGNAKEPVPN